MPFRPDPDRYAEIDHDLDKGIWVHQPCGAVLADESNPTEFRTHTDAYAALMNHQCVTP